MDGGAGEEGKQERHLVLAHKLFLLSHPAVDDLSKVALRAEVLDTVKSDGTVPPLLSSLSSYLRCAAPDVIWFFGISRYGDAV
jgi:26S proteasome regulatory subunit N7